MLPPKQQDGVVKHLDNVRRWDALHSFTTSAASRHACKSFRSRLDTLVRDTSRWSVLDIADIPLEEYAPMPPPAALTKQERTTASQTAVDQHFAAEMLVALKDMLDQSGTRLLVPSARVAFELLWVQVLNPGAPDEQTLNLAEYWMPASTYYGSLWMVQCDDVRDEDPPIPPLPTHTSSIPIPSYLELLHVPACVLFTFIVIAVT